MRVTLLPAHPKRSDMIDAHLLLHSLRLLLSCFCMPSFSCLEHHDQQEQQQRLKANYDQVSTQGLQLRQSVTVHAPAGSRFVSRLTTR